MRQKRVDFDSLSIVRLSADYRNDTKYMLPIHVLYITRTDLSCTGHGVSFI